VAFSPFGARSLPLDGLGPARVIAESVLVAPHREERFCRRYVAV
jgi:hypothetical protein